jgi:hypothetical protein
VNGVSGPFNDISVAPGVTLASPALPNQRAKGCLSIANLVVLYAQIAYDCASVVLRLPYRDPDENK